MRQFLQVVFAFLIVTAFQSCTISQESRQSSEGSRASLPLTIVAIGDAGEAGSVLSGNATCINDMYDGQYGGTLHAMIFLGDDFYYTGLNIRGNEVEGKVKSVLGPFSAVFKELGRSNIHAVAGNHDWYARNALEKSLLFGLIKISEVPVGLSDMGNKRAAGLTVWTYYYRMPGEAIYALGGESKDSIQFVLFDSALLLRTEPVTWRGALDSLEHILVRDRDRRGIVWRALCLHHPFYSVGGHGGYSEWDDESSSVAYVSPCDRDSNAVGYMRNLLDPEDLCADKYRCYVDSVKAAIRRSGTKVQFILAGHDHSLQLLYYPDRDTTYAGWPKVHIISGAGSIPARVKLPAPPYEFTSAEQRPEKEGVSVPGFVQLCFVGDKLRIVFYNGNNGGRVDMGGGRKEFWISEQGNLLNE